MLNPCVELCKMKYGKEYSSECDNKCKYAKIMNENKSLKEEIDKPIKTLEELATQFCCLIECKNCPVYIYNYEKRTEYEKTSLHEPCCSNLYRWIMEESKDR